MSGELVLVGVVSGAFGVRGEIRIRSFTADPEAIVDYGPLLDERGGVLLTPKRLRPLNEGFAITAPEVKTREAAEALKNRKLFVPRANLPDPEEDEFYHVDLIGCAVETLAGEALGEVIAVRNFGADDLLEVKTAAGKTLFLPFTKAAAPVVDIAGRKVVVEEPGGGEVDETDRSD